MMSRLAPTFLLPLLTSGPLCAAVTRVPLPPAELQSLETPSVLAPAEPVAAAAANAPLSASIVPAASPKPAIAEALGAVGALAPRAALDAEAMLRGRSPESLPEEPAASASGGPWAALESLMARAAERPAASNVPALIAAARAKLRDEPAALIEDALADAFARVHRLSSSQRDTVADVLRGRLTLPSLPGVTVRDVLRVGGTLYAFTESDLYARENGAWKRVRSGLRRDLGWGEAGGVLYACDGRQVFAVRGARGRATGIKASGIGQPLEHGGKLYLPSTPVQGKAGSLWVNDGSGWARARGASALGPTGDLAAAGGTLYVGGDRGVFALQDGRWVNRLRGVGNVRIEAAGGRIYAHAIKTHGFQDVEHGFYEIDARETRPVPEKDFFTFLVHGSRAYAILASGGLLERTKKGWRNSLGQERGTIHSSSDWDDTMVVETQSGVYRRDGSSRWRRLDKRRLWVGSTLEHEGRRYLATAAGLMSVGRRGLQAVLSKVLVSGIVAEGRDLFLGTPRGVVRFIVPEERLASGWREEALRELSRGLDGGAAEPSPPSAGRSLLRDSRGRSLLGFTSASGL